MLDRMAMSLGMVFDPEVLARPDSDEVAYSSHVVIAKRQRECGNRLNLVTAQMHELARQVNFCLGSLKFMREGVGRDDFFDCFGALSNCSTSLSQFLTGDFHRLDGNFFREVFDALKRFDRLCTRYPYEVEAVRPLVEERLAFVKEINCLRLRERAERLYDYGQRMLAKNDPSRILFNRFRSFFLQIFDFSSLEKIRKEKEHYYPDLPSFCGLDVSALDVWIRMLEEQVGLLPWKDGEN